MISSLRLYDRCRDSAHEQVYWVILIFIFALGFFLARSHLILQDPDTYWHIATDAGSLSKESCLRVTCFPLR